MSTSDAVGAEFGEARIAEFWNSNSSGWVAGVRQGWDQFRKAFHDPAFYALLGDVSGLDVLDAGCGEGIACRDLAARGARMTGVDICSALIEQARSEGSAITGSIQYHAASVGNLETIQHRSFDRVVSIMALMDAPSLDRAFSEFARVLRPGGELVFSISHPFTDRKGIEWTVGPNPDEYGLKVTGYFDNRAYLDEWQFSNPGASMHPAFRIPTFPRTVSEYLNTLHECSFDLLRVEEPFPSKAAYEKLPVLERWCHMPFYLMARAVLVAPDS